jgi:hypothetical protein
MSSVRALRQSRSGTEAGIHDGYNRRDRRRARIVPEPGSRPAPRTYEQASLLYPHDQLPFVKGRNGRKSIDRVEATVRLLIAQGYPIRRARTLADICAAHEAPENPRS